MTHTPLVKIKIKITIVKEKTPWMQVWRTTPLYPPIWASSNVYHISKYLSQNQRYFHRNWWCGITPLAERSQVTTHIHSILGQRDGCRKAQ
jgi:hypothetical protein